MRISNIKYNHLLTHTYTYFIFIQTVDWWMLRCINVHQQVLDSKSNSLRETAIQLMDSGTSFNVFLVKAMLLLLSISP